MSVYLVTGATGYIGSMLIKYIMQSQDGAEIIALIRDKDKAERLLPEKVKRLQVDLLDRGAVERLDIFCDYMIHCASVTKSAEMVSHPVEVTESIVNTTQNVLRLAGKCNVKSMVYLSSMEVYGKIDCSDGHRVTERELGEVDIYRPRSCYPLGKRMAENICYSYYKEYGIPVKIARLAQTFGRGVLPDDTRVFAQFARSAQEGTDIILHTKGNSMGNYCDIEDAITGIMTILNRGTDGEAYNVVNEANTMTILQMAELVAGKIAGGKIKIVYDIPQDKDCYGYAEDTGLRLSCSKLASLGWRPEKSLEMMYQDLMDKSATVAWCPRTAEKAMGEHLSR